MSLETYQNDMKITQKLYDTKPYDTEFEAKVLFCEKEQVTIDGKKQNLYCVVLDKTLFFPEEGGQSCDAGTLSSVPVVYVSISQKTIKHFAELPFEIGTTVNGKIDFSVRYRNMQHHSGEHIFSGLVNKHFGFTNVGFHLGKNFMTMDYDGELSAEDIDFIEDLANLTIHKNIKIEAAYYSEEQLSQMNYRSKIELFEDVRIVKIKGVDLCACCAPHVATTAEVGIIKVFDFEKYKGGTRLYVLCGNDAVLDYRRKNRDIKALSSVFSAKPNEVVCAAKRMYEENERLKSDINQLTKRLCESICENISQTDTPVTLFDNGLGVGGMRMIANTVAKKSPLVLVADKKDVNLYNFIIASEKFDCREIYSKVSQKFFAKGGGNSKMIQGTISSNPKELSQFWENILK